MNLIIFALFTWGKLCDHGNLLLEPANMSTLGIIQSVGNISFLIKSCQGTYLVGNFSSSAKVLIFLFLMNVNIHKYSTI